MPSRWICLGLGLASLFGLLGGAVSHGSNPAAALACSPRALDHRLGVASVEVPDTAATATPRRPSSVARDTTTQRSATRTLTPTAVAAMCDASEACWRVVAMQGTGGRITVNASVYPGGLPVTLVAFQRPLSGYFDIAVSGSGRQIAFTDEEGLKIADTTQGTVRLLGRSANLMEAASLRPGWAWAPYRLEWEDDESAVLLWLNWGIHGEFELLKAPVSGGQVTLLRSGGGRMSEGEGNRPIDYVSFYSDFPTLRQAYHDIGSVRVFHDVPVGDEAEARTTALGEGRTVAVLPPGTRSVRRLNQPGDADELWVLGSNDYPFGANRTQVVKIDTRTGALRPITPLLPEGVSVLRVERLP